MKFTEHIQSSSERKKINKLYVCLFVRLFVITPVPLSAQSGIRLYTEQVSALICSGISPLVTKKNP